MCLTLADDLSFPAPPASRMAAIKFERVSSDGGNGAFLGCGPLGDAATVGAGGGGGGGGKGRLITGGGGGGGGTEITG